MQPTSLVADLKAALRRELRDRLRRLSAGQRQRESAAIRDALETSPEWGSAERILAFVPLPDEPDLRPLFQVDPTSAVKLCLPRWQGSSETYEAALAGDPGAWVPGPFGIPEPPASSPALPLERLDLILVPGLGFDPRGGRLGRGRGFFDRLLQRATRARRWGIAFDCQIVERIPVEPHDVNVHMLATTRFGLMATH